LISFQSLTADEANRARLRDYANRMTNFRFAEPEKLILKG